MDILMIGNGFDIEHGLPTTYADFLQFVERFHHVYTLVQIKSNTKSKIEDEYLKFIFESPETNDDEALHGYLKDNIWIEHFKFAYKENWKPYFYYAERFKQVDRGFRDLYF